MTDPLATDRLPADAPVAGDPCPGAFGSDALAATLRELEVPYLALVPGSSLRGLHESVVNFQGNRRPQLLLTLHEETAVAIAHGYAKASDRLMAVALHTNVGLMHASMAIYNAWCDRAPVLVLGATGPLDAAARRPWIDWIHTSNDLGGLVRNFTKWDDQPASPRAAMEALTRARQVALTAPRGPVFVGLDVGLQELRLEALPAPLPASRHPVPPPPPPPAAQVAEAARWLAAAHHPVILAGRCSRDPAAWRARVALAERLQAPVLTHLMLAAAFPTDHPLHAGAPGVTPTGEAARRLAEADLVVSLDWLDLAGTLRQAFPAGAAAPRVIQVSCDAHAHRGWSTDYQGLPPVDLYMMCDPDAAVPLLLEAVRPRPASSPERVRPPAARPRTAVLHDLAEALAAATRGTEICYTRFPLGWDGAYAHFRHPLDYLGHDGGAGLGSGPGNTVGAALALQGGGRLAVGLLGDGDFLMGAQALWTAAHYRLPCLMIVCNNRAFHNDERHHVRVAAERGRSLENRGIGHHLAEPEIDLAGLARSMGAEGIGPVEAMDDVAAALERGLRVAREGRPVVLDVRVASGRDAPA